MWDDESGIFSGFVSVEQNVDVQPARTVAPSGNPPEIRLDPLAQSKDLVEWKSRSRLNDHVEKPRLVLDVDGLRLVDGRASHGAQARPCQRGDAILERLTAIAEIRSEREEEIDPLYSRPIRTSAVAHVVLPNPGGDSFRTRTSTS